MTYWYERDTIQDGRRRLWLTRDQHEVYAVPVLASTLSYLQEARAGDISREVTLVCVAEAYDWWTDRLTGDPHLDDPEHRELLALVHTELTAPAAVTPQWFRRLPQGDQDQIGRLIELAAQGRVDRELLQQTLPDAWQRKPQHVLVDDAKVVELFHQLGRFTYDGDPVRPPRRPLTLFRGATAEGRAGLSWTASPAIADHFASVRQEPGQTARVWTAQVPPDRVLAAYHHEEEFVVNLQGLEHLITPAPVDSSSDPTTVRHARRLLWRRTERAAKRADKRWRRAGL